MNNIDFLAIGDITADAFIRLSGNDADIIKNPNEEGSKICFNFGDKIEYDFVKQVYAVGNSPNAAVSAVRLGLSSSLLANVGKDDLGEKTIATLKENGVTTSLIRTHAGKKTNQHYVLWYGAERTILINHEEYPYELSNIGDPQWIYFSSLGEKSIEFHHALAAWQKEHPKTKLAFQPGTFQIRLGKDKLKDLYEVTELFFCNVQEAQRILETEESDIKALLKSMCALGPRISIITDGPRGAYTYDGEEIWHMPMYPDPKEPLDRTGAGDSFASTFTAMLALGESVPEALRRAPINSMSVVQYIGAQEGLLSREVLEEHLKNAPADYKATKVE
ncbi:MAG: carbohydrate kinase family protein [Candidatus Paceibacterota bacterium]